MALTPLRTLATPTDAGGLFTYTWSAISSGYCAQVSVSIPGSPAGVAWSVYVSGTLIGSVLGPSPFGPVFLGGGDVLTVTGTPPGGVSAGTATMVGTLGLQGELAPASPSAGGGTGPVITLLGRIAAGSTSVTVTPSPTATSLIVNTTQQIIAPTAMGTPSDAYLPIGQQGSGTQTQWVAPLPAGPSDTGIIVSLPTAATEPVWIWQTTGQSAVTAAITGPLVPTTPGGTPSSVAPASTPPLPVVASAGPVSLSVTYVEGTSGVSSTNVSGVDSGPNGANLASASGVSSVASPAGAAFGQALEFGSGGSITAPSGTTNAQGAVSGAAFTADILWTPSAADIAGTNQLVLARSGAPYQYQIGSQEGVGAFVWCNWNDSSGTTHFVKNTVALTAGTTYAIRLRWDGATVSLDVCPSGGAVTTASMSVASVEAPVSSDYLYSRDLDGGGVVDEVRISDTDRGALTAFPTAPFTSDANTGCLYHLDAASNSALVQTTPATNALLIVANASGTPTVTDLSGLGGQWPVKLLSATPYVWEALVNGAINVGGVGFEETQYAVAFPASGAPAGTPWYIVQLTALPSPL